VIFLLSEVTGFEMNYPERIDGLNEVWVATVIKPPFS
jgi:hypothetical protein